MLPEHKYANKAFQHFTNFSNVLLGSTHSRTIWWVLDIKYPSAAVVRI